MKITFTQMFMFTALSVFMICDTHTLQAQVAITINSPANIAGTDTNVGGASFGPQLADIGPITGNLVASDSLDGCFPFLNAAAVAGNIALIDRGNCSFSDKATNAEAAGAIAAIICLVDDGEPFEMFSINDTLTIPAIMISKALCDQIRMELPGVNVTLQPAGCTNPDGCNFDPAAIVDNGSCVFPTDACDDEDPFTENDIYQADCTCAGTFSDEFVSACFEPNVGNDISTNGVEGPFDIQSIDMDGDGDNDVLVSFSRADGRIVWYENDGQGNFGSQNIIEADVPFCRSVVSTDLDGDGDNDVIAGISGDDGNVAWYENDGQGNFGSRNIIAMGDGIGGSGVFSIDLDADGDNDVLAGSVGLTAKVAWYENDGQGNFSSENIITSDAVGIAANFAIDLDGDGDNDVLTTSSFEDKITWYENDGQGNFSSEIIIDSDAGALIILAIDLDGDGDNDVISAGGGNVAWYANDGQGNFGSQNIIIATSFTGDIHAADVDGDGDNDILIGNSGASKLSLHENDGQGNFTETIIAGVSNPGGIYVADIDGDGDSDVIYTDPSDDTITWYENQCDIEVITGCTDPDACNFDAEADEDDGSCAFPTDACVDDDPFTQNDVYEADCTCAGIYNPDLEPECFEVNTETVISNDTIGAYKLFAADLDADGDNDILVGTNDNRVLWYENDGQGNFGSENIIATEVFFVGDVYAADLDGDGDKDVIYTAFFGGEVSWHENDGQGNFGSPNIVHPEDDGQGRSIFASDLDGDGDNDIITASSSNQVVWYENDGQGNFGSPNAIAMGPDDVLINSIYAADMDGDGDNDILVAFIFGDVAWYENDGQGGFSENIIVADMDVFEDSPFLVDAADIDGDGDIDVLAAFHIAGKVVWYENDGQGGFGTENVIAQDLGVTFGLHSADMDGDGDNDVLVAFIGTDDKITLYENDGQGGFTEGIISSANDGSWDVYAADLDGDGDNDVIGADGGFPGDGKVVWYENDCDEVTEETIPTVSEWGLIILGLILLNLGVLYIRQTEMRIEQG